MSGQLPTRQRLLAATVLALLGVIAIAASIAFDREPAIALAGRDAPVNAGALNAGDIRANNSPALAQNPLRLNELAVANRVDTPAYACGLHVSRDHGRHWRPLSIPIPRGEQRKCYAPDVTFAADGTLYVSYVTLRGRSNAPHALWVVRSSDGGRSLARPVRVSGPLAFQVRLTSDPQRPKRLYLTWLQPTMIGLYLFAGNENRIQVARSDDGGRRWGKPVASSSPRRQRVLAPSPAVGPDGALYVLYLDVRGDRLDYEAGHGTFGGPPYQGRFSLVLGRSADGGVSWEESLVDDGVVPTRRFLAFLPPSPSLAIDRRSGRIFVAFEDASRSPADVHLWSLARGTRRWSGPTRVNDTPSRDGTSQYMPAIAVAPDGRLDVVYYDRRHDRANRRNQVSVQSSFDAGRSFTHHVALANERFDSRIGAGSERGLADLGSRLGIVSEPGAILAAWADTRSGTVESNKQDIAFARATVSRPWHASAGVRAALRYGGIALLLGGLALLAPFARERLRGAE